MIEPVFTEEDILPPFASIRVNDRIFYDGSVFVCTGFPERYEGRVGAFETRCTQCFTPFTALLNIQRSARVLREKGIGVNRRCEVCRKTPRKRR